MSKDGGRKSSDDGSILMGDLEGTKGWRMEDGGLIG